MSCDLQVALLTLAEQNAGLIVPGYTHLQRAQPVLLQHLLLAYVEQVRNELFMWNALSYHCSISLSVLLNFSIVKNSRSTILHKGCGGNATCELVFTTMMHSIDVIHACEHIISLCLASYFQL